MFKEKRRFLDPQDTSKIDSINNQVAQAIEHRVISAHSQLTSKRTLKSVWFRSIMTSLMTKFIQVCLK